MSVIVKRLGNRLHLQHGLIDLILMCDAGARHRAFSNAVNKFKGILNALVEELPLLRAFNGPRPQGPVAMVMWDAVQPWTVDHEATPMAAVAGAVADHVLAAMVAAGATRARRPTCGRPDSRCVPRRRGQRHRTLPSVAKAQCTAGQRVLNTLQPRGGQILASHSTTCPLVHIVRQILECHVGGHPCADPNRRGSEATLKLSRPSPATAGATLQGVPTKGGAFRHPHVRSLWGTPRAVLPLCWGVAMARWRGAAT